MHQHFKALQTVPEVVSFNPAQVRHLYKETPLIVRGQGTLVFRNTAPSFHLYLNLGAAVLSIRVKDQHVALVLLANGVEKLLKKYPTFPLGGAADNSYWFTLNSLTKTIQFGLKRDSRPTVIFQQKLSSNFLQEVKSKRLIKVRQFNFSDGVVPIRLYREPLMTVELSRAGQATE